MRVATMLALAIVLSFSGSVEAAGAKSGTIEMKVTAYCPCKKCCGEGAYGVTSTGKDANNALGVAADPKILPYGTKLEIPGVGKRVVDDTGGAMRQSRKKGIYHIDVRFQTHEEALKFGVQRLKVKVN